MMTNGSSSLSQGPMVLRTHDLAVGYPLPRRPARVVVDRISVTLNAGELVCLIGPNGAGKSTLMRTLAGMQPPLAGTITLLGDDLRSLAPRDLARRLSIVLTERLEVGILSAYALVSLGRYPHTDWTGSLTERDEAAVRWALEAVGARGLAARNVSELSDGERQKVMIARALAQEPALILLDEPTAFLDLPRRAEIMQLLRRLARATGRAILLSTHDLDLALRSADQVWLLPMDGPLQVGAPEDLVLSGAFEAAFQGDGVHFDTYSGAFRVQVPPAGEISLIGEGIPVVWTARALEREGFCVHHGGGPAAISVEILQHDAETAWRLKRDGQIREFRSLHALIATLRAPTA